MINNAAINGLGDVELVAMETIKRVAEVNYYGMVRVTKSFLPMIKASKGNLSHRCVMIQHNGVIVSRRSLRFALSID